jgi:hypothetical protein
VAPGLSRSNAKTRQGHEIKTLERIHSNPIELLFPASSPSTGCFNGLHPKATSQHFWQLGWKGAKPSAATVLKVGKLTVNTP